MALRMISNRILGQRRALLRELFFVGAVALLWLLLAGDLQVDTRTESLPVGRHLGEGGCSLALGWFLQYGGARFGREGHVCL